MGLRMQCAGGGLALAGCAPLMGTLGHLSCVTLTVTVAFKSVYSGKSAQLPAACLSGVHAAHQVPRARPCTRGLAAAACPRHTRLGIRQPRRQLRRAFACLPWLQPRSPGCERQDCRKRKRRIVHVVVVVVVVDNDVGVVTVVIAVCGIIRGDEVRGDIGIGDGNLVRRSGGRPDRRAFRELADGVGTCRGASEACAAPRGDKRF